MQLKPLPLRGIWMGMGLEMEMGTGAGMGIWQAKLMAIAKKANVNLTHFSHYQ